ncbi:MAG: WXG100 family type VII secretion target [Lachnospiraceae bacterium]|nr:WXG100 family type VII secretion target [Lachnospiraceae bacterium]
MATTITLKVAPETLKSKANEITEQIKRLSSNWEKMEQTIKNSKNYWEGEASDLHQKYCKEVEPGVNTILKRLREHPTDLLNMANLYDEAEQKADEIANALPTDIIF